MTTESSNLFDFESDTVVYNSSFSKAILGLDWFQDLGGFFLITVALVLLLLNRRLFSNSPAIWNYLVTLCFVDFFYTLLLFLELIDYKGKAHLVSQGYVNLVHVERCISDILSDLSTWLLVFIAVEYLIDASRRNKDQHQPRPVSSVLFVGVITMGIISTNVINAFAYSLYLKQQEADNLPVINEPVEQWISIWPLLFEIKGFLLPALALFFINSWLAVYYALVKECQFQMTCFGFLAMFIACRLPWSISYIYGQYFESATDLNDVARVYVRDRIVYWLANCNPTLNCFIFCTLIPEFRQAICGTWQSITEKTSNKLRDSSAIVGKSTSTVQTDDESGSRLIPSDFA